MSDQKSTAVNREIQIPPLHLITLTTTPADTSVGLQVHQNPDHAIEIARVTPNSPSSRTFNDQGELMPLKVGYEILSINGHRIRNAQRFVEMLKHYIHKNPDGSKTEDGGLGGQVKMVISAGERPPGATYVLIKRGKYDKVTRLLEDSRDGSVLGLYLQEKNDKVRVTDFAPTGIFVNSRINKGDVVLAIDGFPIRCVEDVKVALTLSDGGAGGSGISQGLISVLTYNLFRKFRSSVMVMSSRGNGENEIGSKDKEKHTTRKVTMRNVSELYVFGPMIGSGAFSVVKKCKLKETGDIYAMKIVNRSGLDKSLEAALKDEIAILNSLNHKHIMRLYDTFATINSYYLVTEYLEGGELFDRIVEKTTYTEVEARDLCKVLFGAAKYLHEQKVCHRDLKPENLLLKYKDSDLELKIADFGFARRAPTENCLRTICGSPGYVSPEILRREPYGTKTDMWSLGVIIFILIGGYPPFQHAQQKIQFDNIKNGRYKFYDKYWGNVTPEAKHLIELLLCVDPKWRLSAEAALSHPWMKMDPNNLRRSSLFNTIENMREFNYGRRFKSAVKSVMFLNRLSVNTDPNDEEPEDAAPGVNAVFTGRRKRGSITLVGDDLPKDVI